jgi:hypothetical protein
MQQRRWWLRLWGGIRAILFGRRFVRGVAYMAGVQVTCDVNLKDSKSIRVNVGESRKDRFLDFFDIFPSCCNHRDLGCQ